MSPGPARPGTRLPRLRSPPLGGSRAAGARSRAAPSGAQASGPAEGLRGGVRWRERRGHTQGLSPQKGWADWGVSSLPLARQA